MKRYLTLLLMIVGLLTFGQTGTPWTNMGQVRVKAFAINSDTFLITSTAEGDMLLYKDGIWINYPVLDTLGYFFELDQTDPQHVVGAPKFDAIQFNAATVPLTNAEGLLQWNATDGTLDLGMSGGDITQQLGQEMFIKVRNVSGATIENGTPVYFSGRTGNRPNIYPARVDVAATACVRGITTQDIEPNSDGFITTFGYVRQIKTNYSGSGDWGTTWEQGDDLYVSKTVAGQLTNIEPPAPNHADLVATVELVGSAGIGSIFVHLQKHLDFAELSDVNGTPLTTSGQFAVWNNDSAYFDFDYNINDYATNDTLGYYVAAINQMLADYEDYVQATYVPDSMLESLVNAYEIDPVYAADSAKIRADINTNLGKDTTGIFHSNRALLDAIDATDTTWWGRAETDPIYAGDSAAIQAEFDEKLNIDQTTPQSTVGTFTFPKVVGTTDITSPLLVGGSAVDSKITYKSTTGAGTATGIAHQWLGGTNGATVLGTILNNGNVGIGTVSPTKTLHVNSTNSEYQFILERATSNGDAAMMFKSGSGAWTIGGRYSVNNNFAISAGGGLGSENLAVTTTGNVGISTASPTSTLHNAGSFALPYVEKTATYTLTSLDYTVNCTSGTFTVNLPTAVGITGRIYVIKNSGAGTITADPFSTQTIDDNLTITLSQYESIMIQATGSNWVIL